MKNTTFIKENFKSSTLPRLIADYGYKSNKEINECPYLTYARLFMYNPSHAQGTLFEYMEHCRRTGKMADPKTLRVIPTQTYNQVSETLDVFDLISIN
jgi:hypothetical protein